jgi:hypothetical protein
MKDVDSENGKPAMRYKAAEHLKKSSFVELLRICGVPGLHGQPETHLSHLSHLPRGRPAGETEAQA